jgi:hypothetical protein
MNYDYDTVDFIFDTFNYTLFQMRHDPIKIPMETWDDDLIPFSCSHEVFSRWIHSEWIVKEDQFETKNSAQEIIYRWTIVVDFYRGIKERHKEIDIDGVFQSDRRTISFTSQSLFLFEFMTKAKAKFRIQNPIYVSVGHDLHIAKFDENTKLFDFLKEIKSHNTRFDDGNKN